MTLILDAHAILWAIYLPERLTQEVRRLIRDPDNTRLVSEATLWEILAKVGRGKLELAGSSVPRVMQRIEDLQVQFVPIVQADIVLASSLPHHHSDPFDRILIAQAMRLQHPIVTRDAQFASYGIPAVW